MTHRGPFQPQTFWDSVIWPPSTDLALPTCRVDTMVPVRQCEPMSVTTVMIDTFKRCFFIGVVV